MKIKFALLFFFSVILVLTVSRTSDSISRERGSVTDVKERIRRVENGLLLPVVVKGQPSEPMKLTEIEQIFNRPNRQPNARAAARKLGTRLFGRRRKSK